MRRAENHGAAKSHQDNFGELIVAVTDEVMPIMRNPSGAYKVVSLSCLTF
jgi:hypothetical protein